MAQQVSTDEPVNVTSHLHQTVTTTTGLQLQSWSFWEVFYILREGPEGSSLLYYYIMLVVIKTEDEMCITVSFTPR